MKDRILSALKLVVFILCLLVSFKTYVQGAEFYVTAVVRNFAMKNTEPLYRDVYINAGLTNGLKKGVYIDAVRRVTLYDNINSKTLGDTAVKIAKLKVIHTDKSVSIARLVKFYDKETTPLTGPEAVMIGDLIEVSEKQIEK